MDPARFDDPTSDTTSSLPSLEDGLLSAPRTAWPLRRKFQDRRWLHALLFLLTIASTALVGGWAYSAIYRNSTERTPALDGWLWHYNHHRKHSALGHQPPIARLNERNQP